MATLSQNQSASLDANYNQEFVDWTTAKYGHDAEGILTNVNSARTAATEFVEERLKPEIMSNYDNAQALTSSAPLRPTETLPSDLPNITSGGAVPATGVYPQAPAYESGNDHPQRGGESHRNNGGNGVSSRTEESSRVHGNAPERNNGEDGGTAVAGDPARVRESAAGRNNGGYGTPTGTGDPFHVREGGGRLPSQDVTSDFADARARVAQQSEGTGIRKDIGEQVAAQRSENVVNIKENGVKVEENKTTVQASSDILKGEHSKAQSNFAKGYVTEQGTQHIITQNPSDKDYEKKLAEMRRKNGTN